MSSSLSQKLHDLVQEHRQRFDPRAGVGTTIDSVALPLYVQDLHRRAQIHNKSVHEIRQEDQNLLSDSQYPSRECLKPDEVLLLSENPSNLSHSRQSHFASCQYCQLVLATSFPGSEFIDQVSAMLARVSNQLRKSPIECERAEHEELSVVEAPEKTEVLASLHDLFLSELRDIHDAERQILKALPKMTKAITSYELGDAFQQYRKVTATQLERLEQIFETLDVSPQGKRSLAMSGLLNEGSEALNESEEPTVLDAALIATVQKITHYQIASYGTLHTYAKLLSIEEAAESLEHRLEEAKDFDEKLLKLATVSRNVHFA